MPETAAAGGPVTEPAWPRARERFRADLGRHYAYLDSPPGLRTRWRIVRSTESIWALWGFRYAQYLDQEAPRWVRLLAKPFFSPLQRLIEIITGIYLATPARIGPGLYIGHCGGIFVTPSAILGANCNLSQGVTIGIAIRAPHGPILGDRVWIGPNATVTGPVRVGSGAVIGANSLVVADIPENAVVVGVPARVISFGGSAHLINLRDQPASGRR